MLSEYNVNGVLIEVLAPGVNEEPLHIHHLVRDLPQETLLVVSGHLRYRRISTHILLAQVVTLLGPVGLELSDYRFALINEGNRLLGDFSSENLLNVETQFLKLSLEKGEADLGLSHICSV